MRIRPSVKVIMIVTWPRHKTFI